MLKTKKQICNRLGVEVNELKAEIDAVVFEMEDMKAYFGGDAEKDAGGHPVMDEPVFQLYQKSKALKASYRSKYGELQAVMKEVDEIQTLLGLCREKLLVSFSEWYAEVGGKQTNNIRLLKTITSADWLPVPKSEKKPPAASTSSRKGSSFHHGMDAEQRMYEVAKLSTMRRTSSPEKKRRLSLAYSSSGIPSIGGRSTSSSMISLPVIPLDSTR